MKMDSKAITAPERQIQNSIWFRLAALIVVAIVVLALPSFVSTYVRSMVIKILIYALFAVSLNLVFGYAGLFSLGHAAYFGTGAFVAAYIISKLHFNNFWLLILAGILAAAFAAVIFGYLSLKVSGVYFLLVTFAIGQLLYSVAIKWRPVTGGSDGLVGIPMPKGVIPGIEINPTSYYYLVLVVVVVCIFLLYRIAKSPFGVALTGIRGDELRMKALGYNTWLYKYLAFIIGAVFAGLAGVLMVYKDGFVGPGHLSFETSSTAMLMVIIGSDRVFWGPILGAAIMVFLEYFASLYTPERWPLILGAVFIISVTFLRGGVGVHLTKLWNRGVKRYGNA